MRLGIDKTLMKPNYKSFVILGTSSIVQVISCTKPKLTFNEDIQQLKCYYNKACGNKSEYIYLYFMWNKYSYKPCEVKLNRILKGENINKRWEPVEYRKEIDHDVYIDLFSKDISRVFSRDYVYEVIINTKNGTRIECIYHTHAFYIRDDSEYLQHLSDEDYYIYGIPPPDTNTSCSPCKDNLSNLLSFESEGTSPLYDLELSATRDEDNKTTGFKLAGKIKVQIYPKRASKIIITLERALESASYEIYGKLEFKNDTHTIQEACQNIYNQETKTRSEDFKFKITNPEIVLKYTYRFVLSDIYNPGWGDAIITVPMKFAYDSDKNECTIKL